MSRQQLNLVTQVSGTLSYSERAHNYAEQISSGGQLASKWIKLACKRHLDDLERKEWRFVFDSSKAERICRFAELLPHEKGRWAGKRIHLEEFQVFILCSLFGWVDRETGYRRFRESFILMSRKCGKSLLAAIIGLYMLAMDGEQGAEVFSGATTERQALETFRPAKHMVTKVTELRERVGIKVAAKTLYHPASNSRFQPIVGRPGDGSSPHLAIIDEFHEHVDSEQYDAMRTGMGARSQPLLFIISTAGTNLEGPCLAKQREIERVLEGAEENERLFGLIYQADPELDWTSEDALRMATPNYGVSVDAEWLREQQANAIRNVRMQNIFRTKHLNQWLSAKSAWLNSESIHACTDPALEEVAFASDPCWIGLDLAHKIDLAAMVRVYRRLIAGKLHYYVFSSAYLPEAKVNEPGNQHYQGWQKQGFLTVTDGSVTDFSVIEQDVLDFATSGNVQALAYDPWAATQFAQRIAEQTRIEIVEVPQRMQFLSPAAKELEALLADKRIHLPTDPVMFWCLSNLVAKEDRAGNLILGKEDNSKKIDCAMALITALVRASTAPASGPQAAGIFYA